MNVPNLANLPSQVDPRGFLTFGVAGISLIVFAVLIKRGGQLLFTAFLAAFPDLKYTIEVTIAEGDYVAQRVTGTATMKGAFQGMPPSAKRATWTEMHIVRFANGKVVEHWANVDQIGMLTQLGFIQPPPQS